MSEVREPAGEPCWEEWWQERFREVLRAGDRVFGASGDVLQTPTNSGALRRLEKERRDWEQATHWARNWAGQQ